MNSDFAEGHWYDFKYKFDYVADVNIWKANFSEIKKRFQRLASVADWNICNMSHSLQQAFADRKLLKMLGADLNKIDDLLNVIANETHILHTRGYQITALQSIISTMQLNDTDELPWDKHGIINSAAQALDTIIECDLKILIAIKKAIRKLA